MKISENALLHLRKGLLYMGVLAMLISFYMDTYRSLLFTSGFGLSALAGVLKISDGIQTGIVRFFIFLFSIILFACMLVMSERNALSLSSFSWVPGAAWVLFGVVVVILMVWRIVKGYRLYFNDRRKWYKSIPYITIVVGSLLMGLFFSMNDTKLAMIATFFVIAGGVVNLMTRVWPWLKNVNNKK